MNERQAAEREVNWINRTESGIRPGRIRCEDFIRGMGASALISGENNHLVAERLLQAIVTEPGGIPTILLTGWPARMPMLRRMQERGMPVVIVDRDNRSYQFLSSMDPESLRSVIRETARDVLTGESFSNAMRLLSVLELLIGQYRPVTLASLDAALELNFEDVVEMAEEQHLSREMISILDRSADTYQDLRSVMQTLKYSFSMVSRSEAEEAFSLRDAVLQGIPLVAIWQVSPRQESMNRALAEEIRSLVSEVFQVRVVVESAVFKNEDPLLDILLDEMRGGRMSLVVVSDNAANMLRGEDKLDGFESYCVGLHNNNRETQRHLNLFGRHMRAETSLTVHRRRPFSLHRETAWGVARTEQPVVWTRDLMGIGGRHKIACANMDGIYLVDRNFFFR